jgi:thiol-disulfide isomerase/thioredoxin
MVAKRSTTMGKLMPYVDVRSEKEVPQFESMIKTGPVYVLVYADWCGHCRTFKDKMWDEVANSPNKGMNTAAVHYNMVNKTSLKNTKIEGYPTLFEVKPTPKSNVAKVVPTPKAKEELEKLVGTNMTSMKKMNSQLNEDPMSPVSENNRRSERMMANSTMASEDTFVPDALESLPPNVSEDLATPEETNPTQLQRGGSLMETLLKVSADAAHAIVLTGSAIEISKRMKKRKTRSQKRRSSTKKQTRRR